MSNHQTLVTLSEKIDFVEKYKSIIEQQWNIFSNKICNTEGPITVSFPEYIYFGEQIPDKQISHHKIYQQKSTQENITNLSDSDMEESFGETGESYFPLQEKNTLEEPGIIARVF